MENNIGNGCTGCWSQNWALQLVFGLVIFFSGLGVQCDSKAHRPLSVHVKGYREGGRRRSQAAPPALRVAARRSFVGIELRSTVYKSEGMGRERRVRGFSFG